MSVLNHYVQEVSWKDISKEVDQVNSIFASLVNKLSPDSNLKLFRVRYPFGAYVFNNDQVQFPSEIGKKLDGQFFPLALLMNKKLEVFVEVSGNIFPMSLVNVGEILGLSKFFDNQVNRKIMRLNKKITAGARTVFFLSQISNEQGHRKLKARYRVKRSVPKKIMDHWHVFREILDHGHEKNDWYCEVLFFSQVFIEAISRHKNYRVFENYLLSILSEKAHFLRNRESIDSNWKVLLAEMKLNDEKVISNGMEISRRLLDIGSGLYPGFRPAIDDDALPLTLIQNIYLNDYGIKEYAPIIMEPYYLRQSCSAERPVYFSLSFSDQFSNKQSILNELREIIYSNENLERWLVASNHVDFNWMPNLCYKYFYSDQDKTNNIYAASEVVKFDSAFLSEVKRYKNRKFPESSSFLRGAVLIERSN